MILALLKKPGFIPLTKAFGWDQLNFINPSSFYSFKKN